MDVEVAANVVALDSVLGYSSITMVPMGRFEKVFGDAEAKKLIRKMKRAMDIYFEFLDSDMNEDELAALIKREFPN